ncbi:MAG: FAD-dependent oxidoreductase [Bradymonadia bacterium]
MTSPSLHIAVLGAGFAGCATAIHLGALGHRVTLIERVPEPAPVGAGIIVQPTGMHALSTMSALSEVLRLGEPLTALWCQGHRGQAILDLPYAHLHPELFGLGLHRGALFEVLFDRARALSERVCCGLEVSRLRPADIGGSPRWHLEDKAGRRLPDPDTPAFDLVVVATGGSTLLEGGPRLKRSVKVYPWGALWAVLPDPGGPHLPAEGGRLFQVARGTHTLFGLLPSGALSGAPSKKTVSLFWSLPLDAYDGWRTRGLADWRQRVLSLCPESEPVIDLIESPEQLLLARYRDVRMKPWGRDGVLYIGDAAHATSPQLGQGTNLALMDAVALGTAMASLTDADALPAVLAHYHQLRRAHLRWYQRATRWLTPLFQSNLRPIGPLRDLALGLGGRIPYIRRQMLATMSGVKLGTLWPSIPLKPIVKSITHDKS